MCRCVGVLNVHLDSCQCCRLMFSRSAVCVNVGCFGQDTVLGHVHTETCFCVKTHKSCVFGPTVQTYPTYLFGTRKVSQIGRSHEDNTTSSFLEPSHLSVLGYCRNMAVQHGDLHGRGPAPYVVKPSIPR